MVLDLAGGSLSKLTDFLFWHIPNIVSVFLYILVQYNIWVHIVLSLPQPQNQPSSQGALFSFNEKEYLQSKI